MKYALHIKNKIRVNTKYFAAILGAHPSNGARSIVLWNRVFQKLNIPAMFLPFDVKEGHLSELIQALKEDERFIGGAVTAPLKEHIHSLLDELHASAACGAVNTVYRVGPEKLGGMNTDMYGAYMALKKSRDYGNLIDSKKGLSALLWGAGGVAKSIATVLATEPDSPFKHVTVAFRNVRRLTSWRMLMKRHAGLLELQHIDDGLSSSKAYDLFVQCTPVGSRHFGLENNSPLSQNLVASQHILARLTGPSAILFDVNYDPVQSVIMTLWRNIRSSEPMNGIEMNHLQAVVSCSKVLERMHWLKRDERSEENISQIMRMV